MKDFVKLIDYNSENIERGTLLRCKGKFPYEDVVDFLVCEPFIAGEGCRLIVSTGYKAGLTFCIMPINSYQGIRKTGISTDWLKNNWANWGYADCPISDVFLLINYVPEYPTPF